MSDFQSWNAYIRDHFPDGWGEEDFAFLAEFVENEFDAKLLRVLNERDYDYELLREVPADE